MTHLTVNTYSTTSRLYSEVNESAVENKAKELVWVQKYHLSGFLEDAINHLKYCCTELNLSSKCDERLVVGPSHSSPEQYSLVSRHGNSDNIKANVTLLDDNVIHADVTIKYPKAGGGFIRSVAQPDVQWKLQQLQDLGNHICRVSVGFCDLKSQLAAMTEHENFTKDTAKHIYESMKSIKNEICLARSSIQLPRKRSLLELCYFPPTKKFVPPLPNDQLLSLYISSCRLVCASYQMVPKTIHPQGLNVFMAESQLPYLDEIINRLNFIMNSTQKIIQYLDIFQL